MPTLEDELRTTMVEASEHLQLPAGIAERAWRRGHRADADGSPMSWRRTSNRPGTMSHYRRGRLVAVGSGLVVLAIVGTAFALGGSNGTESGGSGSGGAASGAKLDQLQSQLNRVTVHGSATGSSGGTGANGTNGTEGTNGTNGTNGVTSPRSARVPAAPSNGTNDSGTTAFAPENAPSGSSGSTGGTSTSGVTATRVVKNGSMELAVPKGQVQPSVDRLVSLTKGLGGYVAQSHTSSFAGSPSGEVTLRMPVTKFEDAVSAAQKVGHETSLTTSAHDVTGKFVDLNARLSALQRTRQTYLTILGRATTIGQTLEVQQRVEDVQQQIEQLQGSLKVLRNQSADGTLTVAVSETGSSATVAPHQRHGIGKAWHTSVQRFTRGIDAIVAALGPLLLALLILGALLAIGALGYRGVRRATNSP